VFAVSEPRFEPYCCSRLLGRVQVFRAAPPGVRAFGQPCAGTLAKPPRIGIRDAGGNHTRLHVSDAEPQRAAALVLGLSTAMWGPAALPLPLAPFGYPGCDLHVAPDLVCVAVVGASGYAAIDLPFRLAPAGLGNVTVYGQWLALGAGLTAPGGLSAALAWEH
jgi:hypothetical protein